MNINIMTIYIVVIESAVIELKADNLFGEIK